MTRIDDRSLSSGDDGDDGWTDLKGGERLPAEDGWLGCMSGDDVLKREAKTARIRCK